MIQIVHIDHSTAGKLVSVKSFGQNTARKAIAFHKSFPEYAVTPLANLGNLAAYLGVKSIHVKDESYRFGLNAFKVLGGSFAIGNYIADKLGMDIEDLQHPPEVIPEMVTKWKNGAGV